ncbi:hypothetical protein F0L74_31765 [Chitinophaga agrisoli]|uniref:Lipoprotein n=1 Tax=Chitinophaga agrisoli TaxID=2607653 RepID=A0A5B2VNP3_9BACT|nr:hypothetical protein [Chitinophaga agrisoli]KAA2240721.1 hypothetical protein F0L74_31765 [Chitinophaga agrisoli]
MKIFPLLYSILLTSACHTPPGNSQQQADDKTPAPDSSITIPFTDSDSITFSKENMQEVIAFYPELYEEMPDPPDITWARSLHGAETPESGASILFASLAGQDDYYILYGWFLQKHNTGQELKGKRDTLIGIFRNINFVFDYLNNGGTYFGHQFKRIVGYAEYGVYEYRTRNVWFKEPYDVGPQKQCYLAALRQRIADDINAGRDDYSPERLEERRQQISVFVAALDSLITDHFYLRQAQAFQYSHYY